MDLSLKNIAAHQVRLFPTHNISGNREAEIRATSALLAMIRSVSEFGRAVLKLAGAPVGNLECYTEVSFKNEGPPQKSDRPDGLIYVKRGKKEWTAILEVKVGDNMLDYDQVNRYHELASKHKFGALITVSNQAALPNGLPPGMKLNGNRLRSVSVRHLSWSRLLSEAQILSKRKEISDPDQSWMLNEWIKYVSDSESRIIEPPSLGDNWGVLVKAGSEDNLRQNALAALDVAKHWDAFLLKFALRIRAKLGVDVQLRVSKKEQKNPSERFRRLQKEVIESGALSGDFRVPDAAGNLKVLIIIPSRSVQFSTEITAPSKGKQQTRINWLLRQLRDTTISRQLLVKVRWEKRSWTTECRLAKLLEYPESLLRRTDGTLVAKDIMPRVFILEETIKLKNQRGKSSARILEGIANGMEGFYNTLLETIRPYVARAPRLTPSAEDAQNDGITRS